MPGCCWTEAAARGDILRRVQTSLLKLNGDLCRLQLLQLDGNDDDDDVNVLLSRHSVDEKTSDAGVSRDQNDRHF